MGNDFIGGRRNRQFNFAPSKSVPNCETSIFDLLNKAETQGRLACIFHKPWKRHYSVFAPHLSPTVLRAASQAALQRENLTSAWACEIFGLGLEIFAICSFKFEISAYNYQNYYSSIPPMKSDQNI